MPGLSQVRNSWHLPSPELGQNPQTLELLWGESPAWDPPPELAFPSKTTPQLRETAENISKGQSPLEMDTAVGKGAGKAELC